MIINFGLDHFCSKRSLTGLKFCGYWVHIPHDNHNRCRLWWCNTYIYFDVYLWYFVLSFRWVHPVGLWGMTSMQLLTSSLKLAFIIPPASTKLKRGILVSPCPSVRLWTESCPLCIFDNTHRIHFIFAHLIKQLQKVKFWRIFKICNFDFVFFWLGIQYDSMVWVIIRRRGVSSERRRSSCSSFRLLTHWPMGYSILKALSSILFYWLVSSDLFMIMPSDECHGTYLKISQHWSR